MKKIFLLLSCCVLFSACGILSYSNYPFAHHAYIGGYWGDWEHYSIYKFQGTHGNFVVYLQDHHPNDYSYRVTVSNYNEYRVTKNDWAEFQGSIEYKVSEYSLQNNTYKELSKEFVSRSWPTPIGVNIKRPATIRIRKYGSAYVYDIYFDGVGLGVQIPW